MKLACPQEVLADVLATACRVVPTRTTRPVLTNVLLEAEPIAGLRVMATDRGEEGGDQSDRDR